MMMLSQQYFVVVIVALLFLHCSETVAFVPNRPFDAFTLQKQLHDNAYLSTLHRPGLLSPMVFIPRSSGRYAFSFMISPPQPQPPEEHDTTTNRTLLENSNSSQPLHGNSTVFTNSSSANTTTTQNINSKKKSSFSSSSSKSYFPFSFQSYSPSTTKKEPAIKSADRTPFKMKTYYVGKPKKSSSNTNSSATTLLNKAANETITVADLEVLLAKMQSASALSGTKQAVSTNRYGVSTNSVVSTKSGTNPTPKGTLAFPQESEVSATDIRRSTAITGSLLGMIIGITILPNLWLVGMIAGVFYGFEITKDIAVANPANKNALANFLITNATRLAKLYRKVVDGVKALWFLYKTGQLSYEYYKSYEKMDKKFAIQDKVDAWNRVFVKGKQKFDTWEKENEVGRKVLAGLRTAWLLDEESRKRAKGRSRYRVVQAFYDLKKSVIRLLKKTFASIEDGGLESFWKGLQSDLRQEGSLSLRVGAVAAAVVAVNVCGALFSISAGFSNLLAIMAAVIWPSWTTELLNRAQEIWLDTQSSGSSDKGKSSENCFEWIQEKYEEHASNRMKEYRSTRNRGLFGGKRRPKQKRTLTKSKKRKPPAKRRTSSSWFGLGKKPRKSGSVGTWGNYKNTW